LYQATQEARYGATLDFFFQEWVYGTGQPSYEFGWTSADLGNGTRRNYIRVRQTQASGTPFTMPIDLTLVTTGGATSGSVNATVGARACERRGRSRPGSEATPAP
jgi:hypothetical protein